MPTWNIPIDQEPLHVVTVGEWNETQENLRVLGYGRTGAIITRDAGAKYTTTSTTFAAIDATNLTGLITTIGGIVWVIFEGVGRMSPAVGANLEFDFEYGPDGGTLIRYGAAFVNGLACVASSDRQRVGFTVQLALPIGTWRFRPMWRISANNSSQTGELYAGAAVTNEDFAARFYLRETG